MITRWLIFTLIIFPAFLSAQENETADFSSLKINSTGADGDMLDFAISKDQRFIAVANEKKSD